MTTRSICVCVDATADRLGARSLEAFQIIWPQFTVDDFRRMCAEARAQGKRAFMPVPCDQQGDDGSCMGHEEPDVRDIHAAYAEGC